MTSVVPQRCGIDCGLERLRSTFDFVYHVFPTYRFRALQDATIPAF
jgi:hypothetical protein